MMQGNTPLRLTAITLALTLGLTACGKSPEAHLQEGRNLVQQANYKSAIVELKSVLQAQPSNQEARLLLGQAQYQVGAYKDAEKELTKAREQGASDDQVLPLLAMTLSRTGENQKLLDLNIPDRGLNPRSLATLHTARAGALFATGKRPEAEASLTAAEQADPKLPDLLLFRARLALLDKHLAQASQLVENALQSDPKSAEALYLKASMLVNNGKLDEAAKTYQQITANDPTEFRAHLAIAGIQMKNGNIEAADQSVQSAEKIAANNPMVKYTRGRLELQRGKLDRASSALLDVLRVAPDHLPTVMAYAMVSYGLGHYEQSLKNAEKILVAAPDDIFAARILASSQIKLGNIKEALETLNPLLVKHPDDAKLLALAGEAYLQAKDYNKAMSYLDKAAELDPESATIKTHQAASHLAKGDSNEAIADLEKVTSLSNKPGQADLALVLLHLRDKEYDKALQTITILEKKLPTNPVTYNLRAAALLGKKDLAGARDALEQALAIQPTFFPAAVNLARLDIQEKKPEVARKRFEAILAKDKNNVRVMLALADLAAAEKQEKNYVDWLEKAIKVDPKSMSAYTTLVRHYLANKEGAKALSLAKQAINNNPESLMALNLLGETQLASGDNDASQETFNRMVQKAPQSPEVHLRLALIQFINKQLHAARDSLKSALRLQPDFLKAQVALIKVELADSKPEAALAIARQIQQQRPSSNIGFDREGDILLSQRKYPQAIKAYETALTKGAETVGFIKLDRALYLSGHAKDAEQRLSEWIKKHADDELLRAYAAEFYIQTKQNREAIAQYEALLRLKPGNALDLNNLANLYQQEKDGRAMATAEQALKLAPENPAVQDTLGWILVEQGQLPRGLDLLAKAAEKLPKIAAIRYHYGIALMRSGKKAEAKKELAAAIDSGQEFPEKEAAKTLLKNL